MKTMMAVLAALLVVLSTGVCPAAKEYKVSREELDRMSPEMRKTFAGLHYFLNPYQTRQFLSLPTHDERVAWVERFWKQRDPTPTTPENAMEIEHNIRVNLASDAYKSKKWPGWDKRGEVFIRYGPPNYRGKVWAEINVHGMEPPGELWFYTRHRMLVSFQNFGLKGEFIYSIDGLGPAEKFSPELTEFLLYDTDTALSQQIPQQYLQYYSAPAYAAVPVTAVPGREEGFRMDRPRELDAAIDALMDPDRIDMVPNNIMTMFQQDEIREVANNFEIVLEETPESYPFNFEHKDLPFYFSIDQFRGGPETNRVDISLEVPVVIDEGGETPTGETYHAEVVIWDADYNQITRRETDIVVRAESSVTDFSSLIPSQLMVGLPRGYYRLGISVAGEKSQRSSSYRTTFSCEPYGVQLAISDIMFASRIEKTGNSSIFTRGPLDVVPHPVRAYSRSFSMPIYFELYNLTLDDRGVSSYTIDYRIVPHSLTKKDFFDRFDGGATGVSSTFQSSGVSPHETQYLYLNMENLRKGAYDFLITLTDDITQQVVFQRGTFSLVD